MSASGFIYRIAGAGLLSALALTSAFSQVLGVEKLKSVNILDIAKSGVSQDLIVEFESGGIELQNDGERNKVIKKHDEEHARARRAGSPTKPIDDDAKIQDDNLFQALRSQLAAIKQATFADKLSGNCKIIHDFPLSPSAEVRVPDFDSLLKLLANQSVKRVMAEEALHLDALWPTSFSGKPIVDYDSASAGLLR